MDNYTLPTILVYVFSFGSVLLLIVLIWSAQQRLTSWRNRPKYKSQKMVDDYYDASDKEKTKIDSSAVSAHIAERWRQNLRDLDDI